MRPLSGYLALLSVTQMCLWSAVVEASDYYHVCRTADGRYEMNDEVLYRVGPQGPSDKSIPFTRRTETTLRREVGYCISKKAGKQRFGYESRVYTLSADFTDEGRAIAGDFLCEMYADGMPAAFACDEQVVTVREGPRAGELPPPPASGVSRWMHNGSVMRLTAEGNRRFFHYETPRVGMLKAGAKSGTLLFEGVRLGDRYTGQAYIFRKGCEPHPYIVEGEVSADERRIALRGKAPRLDKTCTVTSTRDDVLIFIYQPELR